MNILITGGTGFIGTELGRVLLSKGHSLTIITRSPRKYNSEAAANRRYISWDGDLAAAMEEADAVINLAGENIFGQRWTDEVKKRLLSSRIDTTKALVNAIAKAESKPEVMISASAVGYYGSTGDRWADEEAPAGDDFLARLCVDWEAAAEPVKEEGVRLAIPRIGIVLETGGGALQQMLLPFKLFVGGPVGDGSQFVPWVHMDDLLRGFLFALEKEDFEGAFNVCSPNPVTMGELANQIGEVLNRPSWLPVPEFVLNIVLGEAAGPILNSLKVQPRKLQQAGFEFQFEYVDDALSEILP